MIVKFNDPKCGCCPLSVHGFGSSGPAEPAIVLKPGVNTLSPSQYDQIKKTKIFQHRVETGTYQVNEKTSGDSILGLHETAAIELVGETLDPKLLKKWMVDEQRKDVRAAIDAQLDKVKPEVKTPAKTS